jgi:3-dehydroquinate synthase
VVEREVLFRLQEYLPTGHGKVFAITEESLWQTHGKLIDAIPAEVLFLPGGEPSKRLATLEVLAEQMMDAGADRTSVVLAFGGGIVNDMAGFLAAIFMRGIPVIQLPTTLLAQVDAAIGGKTGVNLTRGKNLIGSFHQPHAVLIDPLLLATLPEREYRAGLYEVIKCGVIANAPLFEMLRDRREDVLARSPNVVDRLISECVQLKAEVVSEDEREAGRRRILNFGHTIGHAIEAETGYTRFLHGEAVAMGMKGATYLSLASGKISASDAASVLGLIEQYGPTPDADGISAESVFDRLIHDKKTLQGTVRFILPTGIGSTEFAAGLDADAILAAITQALA